MPRQTGYKYQLKASLKAKQRAIIIGYAAYMGISSSGLMNEVLSRWTGSLPSDVQEECFRLGSQKQPRKK